MSSVAAAKVDISFDKKWQLAHPERESRGELISRVLQRWSKFMTKESFDSARSYDPREDDVFICTHAKAGTTLTQQIVHQLRSNGDINFGEISLTIPWIEIAHDLNINLNDPQKYSPRAFKSHFDWDNVPKKLNSKVKIVVLGI